MAARITYEKLPLDFYQRGNVLDVARDLMGKILVTRWNREITSGRIVEVEAYEGVIDRASHAFGGRRTSRNEIMYRDGGFAYVYLCYGVHHLFNVVTHFENTPHAVLIRALEPLEGMDLMLERSGKQRVDRTLARGPGNLSRALGITTAHTGHLLTGDRMYLASDGFTYADDEIGRSPRIGVEYAGPHALWPYRFFVKGHPNVSGAGRFNR
jgi:DNA-3-methyladenine glycosylase